MNYGFTLVIAIGEDESSDQYDEEVLCSGRVDVGPRLFSDFVLLLDVHMMIPDVMSVDVMLMLCVYGVIIISELTTNSSHVEYHMGHAVGSY